MGFPVDDLSGDGGPMTQHLEDRAPRMHWMAERRSENDSRHLSQFMVEL